MTFVLNRRHAITYLVAWYEATPSYAGFTFEALEEITNYLDETETTREIDPILLACEWTEMTHDDAISQWYTDCEQWWAEEKHTEPTDPPKPEGIDMVVHGLTLQTTCFKLCNTIVYCDF